MSPESGNNSHKNDSKTNAPPTATAQQNALAKSLLRSATHFMHSTLIYDLNSSVCYTAKMAYMRSEAPSLRHTASDAVNSFATAGMGTVEKENTGRKKKNGAKTRRKSILN